MRRYWLLHGSCLAVKRQGKECAPYRGVGVKREQFAPQTGVRPNARAGRGG